MKVIKSYAVDNPQEAAQKFSIILAGDKGVSNKIEKRKDGWYVVADDNRAVHFFQY